MALRFLVARNRARLAFLSLSVIPAILAGALIARNVGISGTWKGGNEMSVHHSAKSVLTEYVKGHLHLAIGGHALTVGVWEVLLVIGALGFSIVVAALLLRGGRPKAVIEPSVILVGLCVVVYSAAMFYAGMRTVISFGMRMYLPLMPMYLLLFGKGMDLLTRGRLRGKAGGLAGAFLVLVVVGYAGVNARDFRMASRPARYKELESLFAMPMAGGQPLREWVEGNIASTQTILSVEGQATGRLLRRQTVSLIEPEYSLTRWECNQLQRESERFTAPYLIVYKPPYSSDPGELFNSRFLARAVEGEPPCGYTVAAENAAVRILKAPSLDQRGGR
jgi:hypothetical protein